MWVGVRAARLGSGMLSIQIVWPQIVWPPDHRFGAAVVSAFGHGDTTEQTELNTHKSAMLASLVLS